MLAQDRDRFAREPALHYLLETEFKRYGTKIAAINDWGGDTPEGGLLRGIQDQIAKYERTLIMERTRRGKLRRAREGKVVPAGAPPLGFEYLPVVGNYRITSQMELERRMFTLVASGMALHAVKKTFEGEGIRTGGNLSMLGGSRFWNINTIRRTILHDAYLPHTFEEIEALVSPEVAAKLDPTKCYGVDWYNRRGTVTDANGRRSKGTEKPREERIVVPVPDAGMPAEVVTRARASLKGFKPSKVAGRYWQLSGHAYCACGCRLISRTTRRSGKAYSYYVCSRYMRDGSEAYGHGKWHNAVKLERRVCEALRSVRPKTSEPRYRPK